VTDTDPTLAGLLRGVLEAPEDDVPRLVAADWLEENGEAEYGDFIRVQCELAQFATPVCSRLCNDCAKCVLRRRERELLNAHRMDWFAIPGLQRPWSNAKDDVVWATGSGQGYELYFGGKVRRGFIESVSCDLATFMGGPCPGCIEPGELDDGDSRCRLCSGTGRTPGIALRLFASQPVRHVTLTCREPSPTRFGGFSWSSWPGQTNTVPDIVLSDYFNYGPHPTEAAAFAYLSDRLVDYGRARAGLPPLGQLAGTD
jgi:uncharacterized protein (TIGR02996 family)